MEFLKFLFSPNRYSLIGIILLIVGFFLAPFLIGFIIMPVGIVFLVFGTFYSIFTLFPGHKQWEIKIKKFLNQYVDSSPLLKYLLHKK